MNEEAMVKWEAFVLGVICAASDFVEGVAPLKAEPETEGDLQFLLGYEWAQK